MRLGSWIKHLRNRRGSKFAKQMFNMWRFHRTSFTQILSNIFEACDTYDAGFTFPTVASVTPYQPDNIRSILREGHEIANHGYKHVKYPFLTDRQQEVEFRKSVQIFKDLGIPIKGFRAPYNSYNETTIKLVEDFGFAWDGGVGYKPEYRKSHDMFYYQMENGTDTSFVSIPCHRYSDDLLIDRYLMDAKNMSKLLSAVIKQASKTQGVVMFDLHPIRIGQEKYVQVLHDLIAYAHELNGWIPTVNEAVSYWKDHSSWKHNTDFCLLLTGDIDNFVFYDYLRRFR